MEVQAITRNVRMSAQKMREVARQIQGLNALQAQAVLAVVARKSARFRGQDAGQRAGRRRAPPLGVE